MGPTLGAAGPALIAGRGDPASWSARLVSCCAQPAEGGHRHWASTEAPSFGCVLCHGGDALCRPVRGRCQQDPASLGGAGPREGMREAKVLPTQSLQEAVTRPVLPRKRNLKSLSDTTVPRETEGRPGARQGLGGPGKSRRPVFRRCPRHTLCPAHGDTAHPRLH